MEEFEPKRKNKVIDKEFIAKYSYVFVLAVLLIGGISYGYTFFTENRKIASGSITTANLTINFSNRNISASNLTVPTNDQEGLSEYSKSLTITNQTAIDGKVKLTISRSSGIVLTNMRYAIVVNGAIQEIDDVPASGEILTSAIMGNETIDVEIRLWPKTTYSGSDTTFVGTIEPEISYLGNTATDTTNLTGKYVNFNCSNTCEVWQIVKVEDDRLVLTRQSDYSGATSRTNSNRYNPSLSFNDNSLITSVSTDNKNVYLAKTVKITNGSGTQADPYTLVNNEFREEDKKVIAVITYKHDSTTTIGTQNVYYNETNYISQVEDEMDFEGWFDDDYDYQLGDVISFTNDNELFAFIVPKLRTKIVQKCNDSNITYVQKYNTANGAPIDTPNGSGNEDVCYYTSDDSTNLAGQYGNVIFGNYCWQIVRTTADGGVKLIYNGRKTNDNKCPNDNSLRPSTLGVQGTYKSAVNASGTKTYGSYYFIFDDNGTKKFKLLDTSSYTWNESTYQSILGKYACGTSSAMTGDTDECEVLYYIGYYYSSATIYATQYTIATNADYSQIGTSTFGPVNGGATTVGYKFKESYKSTYRGTTNLAIEIFTSEFNPSPYYYGDTATWNTNTNQYDLTVGGVTPTTTTPSSSIANKVGYYTCKNTTDTSCATVYYVLQAYNNGTLTTIDLSNNEEISTKTVTFRIGTGYSYENGVYSLTGTSDKTINALNFYNNPNSSSYYGYYVCDNLTSATCTSEVRYVMATNNRNFTYDSSNNNYTYANDVEYVNGEYKLILSDPTNKPYRSFWDWSKKYNTANGVNAAHYTCYDRYNEATNSCGSSIYYINSTSYSSVSQWELFNGDKIEDILQGMLNINNTTSSGINLYNSPIKGTVDNWYRYNLSYLDVYLDNNAVFCNDRSFSDMGIYSPSGGITSPRFKNYTAPTKANASLGCTNISDRFSKNNPDEAGLTYSIGLLTSSEKALMQDHYSATGQVYLLMSPRALNYINAVSTTGGSGNTIVTSAGAVRPVIVLRPGVSILDGDGTYNTPYRINTSEVVISQ